MYAFYANLYNQKSELKWAAMAKLAGGEVFRGLGELEKQIKLNELAMKHAGGDFGSVALLSVVNSKTGDILEKLIGMQKDIFLDLTWQHQAYLETGLPALEAANRRGELSNELLAAWRGISSGNTESINSGNYALLKREQLEILQKQYDIIKNYRDFDKIPKEMSERTLSPIPGGKSFNDVVSGGDITIFADRWKWITTDMIPTFERLSPSELKRLVNLPLETLAQRKYGNNN